MSKILVFLFVIFALQRQFIYNKQKVSPILFDIMFQDYFKNDTLDLKINNVSIVDGMILNSNSAGFTRLQLDISRLNSKSLKISFLNRYKYCTLTNNVVLVLYLNGKMHRIVLNWSKGKFVGLSKRNPNDFYLTQQDEPFAYE